MNDMLHISKIIKLHCSYRAEIRDLMDNGYLFLFNSRVGDAEVTKLKHRSNGKILCLVLKRDSWMIKENGRVIKEVKPV